MAVDAKTMAVVMAVKQAVETSSNPGLSVNSHPNPLFIKVIGDIDLLNIARRVLASLEAHEEGAKARFAARVKKLAESVHAELKAGAEDIATAFTNLEENAKEKWDHTHEEVLAAGQKVYADLLKDKPAP